MEPLIHFIVPFIALTLAGVKFRKALPVSLLALLPDLDVLFLVHRSFSHSFLVVLSVIAPLMLLSFRFKPRFYNVAFLAFMSVSSHLVLDLFTGYTPILWPVYNYSALVQAEVLAHIGSSPRFSVNAKLLTRPTVFKSYQDFDAVLFNGKSLILLVVLLTPFLFKAFKAWWPKLISR